MFFIISKQGFELLTKRKEGSGQFFPTGLPGLDDVLHGGIPKGTVTEVSSLSLIFNIRLVRVGQLKSFELILTM